MATIAELKELALHAVRGTAPVNYSKENVEDALRAELRNFGGSINQFMKNRYDIYEVLVAAADERIPNNVMNMFGRFADILVVGQGQKAVFKQKIGKLRGKRFITAVGLSGVYETFRLDTTDFEVKAHAVGGGATIDFERYLDGAVDLVDLMDVITEGISDTIYGEVQKALIAAFATMPALNKRSVTGFDAAQMVKLIATVKAYGSNAVIFACPEFIAAMGPDAIAPVGASYQGVYSPKDIEAIHDTGLINMFRGTPVVEIPQSFTDETNLRTVANPQYAYVLPTGDEKVVKLVLEGDTQINDFKNRDNSMEIHAYKKVGVAILSNHNWGIYRNTNIADTTITDRQ